MTTSKTRTAAQIATRIANQPMVAWERLVLRLPQNIRIEVEQELCARIQRFTRLACYISRRTTGGRHADAVKAQNRGVAKVRAALGYTYKQEPVVF